MSQKQLVRRWFEDVWNQRNTETIRRMFANDGVAHGLGANGQDLVGPDAFLVFHSAFTNAFGDLKINLEDLVEEDDRVAVRWRATGTHTGHGLGFAPTSKTIAVEGMSILRIVDGQIVEAWNNFDVLGMHQQLGTLAAIAGA